MDKISVCQGCSAVAKLTSCSNCYALVCGDCAYNRGCRLCMGGRRLKQLDKTFAKFSVTDQETCGHRLTEAYQRYASNPLTLAR